MNSEKTWAWRKLRSSAQRLGRIRKRRMRKCKMKKINYREKDFDKAEIAATTTAETRDDEKPNDSDITFAVEAIVGKCIRDSPDQSGKQVLYEVKWEGYPSSENSWKDISKLQNCLDLIEAFEANLATKKDSETPITSGKCTSNPSSRPASSQEMNGKNPLLPAHQNVSQNGQSQTNEDKDPDDNNVTGLEDTSCLDSESTISAVTNCGTLFDEPITETCVRPLRIVNIRKGIDEIEYEVEWDSGVVTLLGSTKCRQVCPDLIIAFFSTISIWEHSLVVAKKLSV